MSSQFSNQPTCDVCENPVFHADNSKLDDQDYTVCHAFDCKWLMSQRSTMAPFAFEHQLKSKRELILRRKRAQKAKQQHEARINAIENRQNQEILHTALENNPGLSKNNTYVLSIPSGLSRMVPLSEERIKAYSEHLKSIISQAAGYASPDDLPEDQAYDAHAKGLLIDKRLDDRPGLRTVSDKLCAMCKGGCCPSGKDHAYQTVNSMTWFMHRHPDLSQEDILSLYLSRLSSESVEGACINQTVSGCSLSRDMRADTCNMYYCDPLTAYHKELEAKGENGTVLAVQRSNTNWNRFESELGNKIIDSALIDEEK